ncbi:MAG: nucleoside 2-deoxyribosyltransferase [Armatimonadota bacterium]|nr:nucleoside 2-deoxyribosyltransferase [Armatimonadota bacterium]
MTAPYEAEVRVRVSRIGELRARLAALGARRVETYAFTDRYYRPAASRWSPAERTLRVRERSSGDAEVLYTRTTLLTEGGVTFKRSALPQGKAVLFRGAATECRSLLEELGFVHWLTVRKVSGELLEIPGAGMVACEEIDGHGWWVEVEVEGADPDDASSRLRARLDALGIDPADASPLPMAALLSPASGRRVYFCGAIRGGRQLQARYARFIAAMQAAGWTVLTAHVGAPDVLAREARAAASPQEIYRRDMAWLADADVVVAEVTVPSLGVGIELAVALERGLPVIGLVQRDASLSALVEGDDRIRLIRYDDEAGAVAALDRALAALVR